MKTIAICNHKGGVGKTATAMAFSECLSKKGYKTLLIDLDQQLNATMIANVDIADNDVTVYDLLTSFDYNARDAIKHYKHGDIIPGDILVAEAEVAISRLDTSLTMLTDALESVEDDYDYCIIDCPPSLGLVTRNAIVAADEVIVVVLPDAASVDGFAKIASMVESISANKRLNPKVKIAGILINTFDERGKLERELVRALPILAAKANTKVFDSKIRKCISVRQAQSSKVSLYDFAPNCTSALDIQAFTDEYLTK